MGELLYFKKKPREKAVKFSDIKHIGIILENGIQLSIPRKLFGRIVRLLEDHKVNTYIEE